MISTNTIAILLRMAEQPTAYDRLVLVNSDAESDLLADHLLHAWCVRNVNDHMVMSLGGQFDVIMATAGVNDHQLQMATNDSLAAGTPQIAFGRC